MGKNVKSMEQQSNLQTRGSICIARPIWKCLSGQLKLQPIVALQFRWNALNSTIRYQELQFNPKTYKLSPQSSMQKTHNPRLMLRKLQKPLETPKSRKLVIGREISRIKSKPKPKSSKLEIKVQKPYSSMLSMSMATIGLDLYVKSIQ